MRSNERRNGFEQRCGGLESPNYFEATLPDGAAASLSITFRHPVLRLALFFFMQAVMAGMLGISELHSRNASPVHICCASAEYAKLEVDDSAEIEAAKATTKAAWRMVRVIKAVMVGSCWPSSAGRF